MIGTLASQLSADQERKGSSTKNSGDLDNTGDLCLQRSVKCRKLYCSSQSKICLRRLENFCIFSPGFSANEPGHILLNTRKLVNTHENGIAYYHLDALLVVDWF